MGREMMATKQENRPMTSHLTMFVTRFLRALENMKSWNQLDSLKGAAELKRDLCNIIEYTFYFHKQQITEQEVEQLVYLLESGGQPQQ